MSDLLPCPFCGSDVGITHIYDGEEVISCYGCGMGMRDDTPKLLANKWNTRADHIPDTSKEITPAHLQAIKDAMLALGIASPESEEELANRAMHYSFKVALTASKVIADYMKPSSSELPNSWISVDDRLPDDDRDVLVFDDGFFLTGGYNKKEKRWEASWDWCESIHSVTHWMPLPEPPNV